MNVDNAKFFRWSIMTGDGYRQWLGQAFINTEVDLA